MWTDENRQRYNRDKLRYPSDLADDEWSEERWSAWSRQRFAFDKWITRRLVS